METISGNCSCVLFPGGKEQGTLKEISAMLGKETIDMFNTSDTRGSQRSYGLNYQKLGKDLLLAQREGCTQLSTGDDMKQHQHSY